jgi:translation initiation factor 3 subunit E
MLCATLIFVFRDMRQTSSSLFCRYLNAIQTNAHHLLRYLATAAIVNKRRRNMLKDLIKVIQQEHYTYSDPITEFLECLYVNYDFEGAELKLRECEEVRPTSSS